MACSSGSVAAKALPTIDSITESRLAICNKCLLNKKGVCEPYKEKHPERDALISIGVTRIDAECPVGKWHYVPVTCQRCRRPRQKIKHSEGVCKWCMIDLSITKGRPSKLPKLEAKPSFTFPKQSFDLGSEIQWVSSHQMIHDANTLASMLPHDIKAIIGVARSGMAAASYIAMRLHLPLFSLRPTAKDIISVGNGWRLHRDSDCDIATDRVAVIDDTAMTGSSLRTTHLVLRRAGVKDFITASLYVNPSASLKPDLFVHRLQWPHLLEWNLFNSVLSHSIACDMDGVICHNPKPGESYKDLRPLHLPRKAAVPLIVTARRERDRAETEEWLLRHGIRFHRLVMFPGEVRDRIAEWKADIVKGWMLTHRARPKPHLFIESTPSIAKHVASAANIISICTDNHQVYVP